MSFESELKERLYDRLAASAGGNNATALTLESLDEMADDIAHATANDVQLALVSELNNVTSANDALCTAISAFMTAFAAWVVVPGDGGAVLKTACSALATTTSNAATALKTANAELEAKAAEYGG